MGQSLVKNLIHLIYSTKDRKPFLTPTVRPHLYAYQAGVLKLCDSPAIVVGGDKEHVHALFLLSKNWKLCDVIEEVKTASSKWMKTQGTDFVDFYWQRGYGAFSIGESQIEDVRRYIENQEEHHKTVSFQDEFRLFLKRYRIEYDEKYVWD